MSIWQKIKEIFSRFFVPIDESEISAEDIPVIEGNTLQESELVEPVEHTPLEEIEALKATLEKNGKFHTHNIIAEKLNYLEQYIKIFSLNFPNEYNEFLNTIQKYREEYDEELKKYHSSFEGNIAFTIDPEKESQRLLECL